MSKVTEIVFARMEKTTHIPQLGNIPKELTNTANGGNKAYKMTLCEGLVSLTTTVPNSKKTLTFLVPANKFDVLLPKEEPVAKDSKDAPAGNAN